MKRIKIPPYLIALALLAVSCSHEITPGQLAAGPQKVDESAVVSGTVRVKEGFVPKGTGTLFLIARKKGETSGPPLAVKRVEDPVFPIGFQMSQKNVMIPSNRFEGELTLSAKWSRQGSPMAESPGDLSTSSGLDVTVGATGLMVELDRLLE